MESVPPESNKVLEFIRTLSMKTLLFPPDEDERMEIHLNVCCPASKSKDTDWNALTEVPDQESCNTSSI